MIREARERAGLSVAQLAAMVGVGAHVIAQAEDYRRRPVPAMLYAYTVAIAEALGLDGPDVIAHWLHVQSRRWAAVDAVAHQAVVSELVPVIELAQRVLRCDDAATLQRIREVLDEMDSAG